MFKFWPNTTKQKQDRLKNNRIKPDGLPVFITHNEKSMLTPTTCPMQQEAGADTSIKYYYNLGACSALFREEIKSHYFSLGGT